MYGPNYNYPARTPETYCHRSRRAAELVRQVKRTFAEIFNLQQYDILLIPGPATVAMQAVIESVVRNIFVAGHGRFVDRWRAMAHWRNQIGRKPMGLYCLLETSESCYTPRAPVNLAGPPFIVDAVSGFPYYRMPDETGFFVVGSNKLLGAPPGISIVGVRKDAWGLVYPADIYTSLLSHRGDAFTTTAPVAVLEHLTENLNPMFCGDQVTKVNKVCEQLEKLLPPELYIGERICPVVTLKRPDFDALHPGVAQRLGLYPCETKPDTDRYHIFTYSEHISNYDQLFELLSHAL